MDDQQQDEQKHRQQQDYEGGQRRDDRVTQRRIGAFDRIAQQVDEPAAQHAGFDPGREDRPQRQQDAGDDAGHGERNDHPEQGLRRRRAEVGAGLKVRKSSIMLNAR